VIVLEAAVILPTMKKMEIDRKRMFESRKALWMSLFLLFSGMAFSGCWTEEQKKRQTLPQFQFEGLLGEPVQRSDFKEGTPLTVVYFDPNCDHCVETMTSIHQNLAAFKAQGLLIVSGAQRNLTIPYLKDRGFLDNPDVKIGLTTPDGFLESFGTTEAPTTLFYGGDFDLKRAYKGPIDSASVVLGIRYGKGEVTDN
jgi:hypothetical protein